MNKLVYVIILMSLNITFLCQDNSFKNFKNVQSNCYCNTTESTPDAILKMDNNWELVNSLTAPKTLSQLESSGVRYSESQIKLLLNWHLISKSKDDTYKIEIPVFDSIRTSVLRQYSLRLSKELTELIKDNVINLKKALKKINREPNTYSILFSYVLDGLVWDNLEADSLLPDYEITIKKPFWAGEYWLMYPKRKFSCGTNSISDKGYSIKVNWSEKAIPYMKPFVTRWDLLEKILNDLITKNKVEDKEAIEVFGQFNIFNSNGNFTVPEIEENKSNDLSNISRDISGIINTFLTSKVDTGYLINEFALKDRKQAVIILYHEIMWDMLDIMESDGLITKPAVFTDPEKSEASDVSDLVIITKK